MVANQHSRQRGQKQSRNVKVWCGCGCNQRLSSAQRSRHMRGLAPNFIAASSTHMRRADLDYVRTGLVSNTPTALAFLSDRDNVNLTGREEGNTESSTAENNMSLDGPHIHHDNEDDNYDEVTFNDDPAGEYRSQNDDNVTLVLSAATQHSLISREALALSDDESESLSERDGEDSLEEDFSAEDNFFDWALINEELVENERGLAAEQLLGEDFEREAAGDENRLTDEDLLIIRAFQFKHSYFIPQNALKALPFFFPQVRIPSMDRIRSRIQFLSGLKTVIYDCCINSCCCFLGVYESDKCCRFCGESRYMEDGKTGRKKYTYSPLIPRLCGMYENKPLCAELLYRHEYKKPVNADDWSRNADNLIEMTDIWDGKVYKELKERYITINDKMLDTKYFSDPHDIALGLTTDGFAPWRRRKYTAWPLLIVNYNIPPEARFHQKNIILLSVIPGPKKPKDIDSFLYPLVEELLKLSDGVRAFDASTGRFFCLRAFLIIAFGDIPAISLLMKMKGHNAIAPCRLCNIQGLRIPDADGTAHYVPLDRSSHPEPGHILRYDPQKLPMRTNEEFLSNAQSVITARTLAEEDILAKTYGIKGKTILTMLDSLSFPRSFPYDFMHLIYENLLKNLILLWTNEFKGLNTGTGNYALSATVWDAIGVATAVSSDTIPSAYSARLASISGDRSTFTADNYSFWALYIGPVLLQRKFNHQRYYDHFIELVQLLHKCLKYEYTLADVKDIRDGFVKWVVSYERLYYQYTPSRLSACPLTVHALLHIADGIEDCGPVWAYWAFPMERFCGKLQRAVFNSRRHPYATLDKFVEESAMLSQVKMRYNLFSELSLAQKQTKEYGHHIPSYPTCTLLPPHSLNPLPSNVVDRISAALATRYNVRKNVAKRHVPDVIDQWGKVRRIDDGDTMVAALLGKAHLDRRDATHIRYQALVDLHARNRKQLSKFNNATFYGQLLRIFTFTVAASTEIKLSQAETVIFAEIQPCKILSKHNILDIRYYKTYGTPLVFDITCIQCLVGRVKLDNGSGASEWAIIDRSGTLAQAYYTEDGEDNSQ